MKDLKVFGLSNMKSELPRLCLWIQPTAVEILIEIRLVESTGVESGSRGLTILCPFI